MGLAESAVQKSRFVPYRLLGLGLGLSALMFLTFLVGLSIDATWWMPFARWYWIVPVPGLVIGSVAFLGRSVARDRRLSWALFVSAVYYTLPAILELLLLTGVVSSSEPWPLSAVVDIGDYILLGSFLVLGGLSFRRKINGRSRLLGWAFVAFSGHCLVGMLDWSYYLFAHGSNVEFLRSAVWTVGRFGCLFASCLVARLYLRVARDPASVQESWLATRDLMLMVISVSLLLEFLADVRLGHILGWPYALRTWRFVPVFIFGAGAFLLSWIQRGGIRVWKHWRKARVAPGDTHWFD